MMEGVSTTLNVWLQEF